MRREHVVGLSVRCVLRQFEFAVRFPFVIPAKAGIHFAPQTKIKMDSGFRRNNGTGARHGPTRVTTHHKPPSSAINPRIIANA